MTQNVLVIEDDEATRTSLHDFLNGNGYPVLTASNGRDALDLLKTIQSPALILLDLMMPVMGGQEFLAVRRADARLKQIPVVLMSAQMCEWNDERAVGVEHMLSKPFIAGDLLNVVRRYSRPNSDLVNHPSKEAW
jgi:CheY-like chemotaxis protein